MIQSDQNWMLFGFDMRTLGKVWQSAWREFLWGSDSPIKKALDETVHVLGPGEIERYFQGGHPVAAVETACRAIVMPPELVLTRELRLPIAVETDLPAVMSIEIGACSPFPADDTGSGWEVVERTDSHLRVQLAIVSLSATMGFLGKHYDCHDVHAFEIWVECEGMMITLSGFGEAERESLYRKRLRRSTLIVTYSLSILVVLSAIAAGMKYVELSRHEGLSVEIQSQAKEVSQLRNALTSANTTLSVINELVRQNPSPHYELARLTQLLGDDTSISQFAMNQGEIRVRGRSVDAAAVMHQLTDQAAYTEVLAPQAITKLGNTGLEQFFLNIKLNKGEGS